MVAILDVCVNQCFKLHINRGNEGLGVLCLQVVPDLLSCLHMYYFIFASLTKPDDNMELHWLKVCIYTHFLLACFPSHYRMVNTMHYQLSYFIPLPSQRH